MGILWWRGNKDAPSPTGLKTPIQKHDPTQKSEVPGMNGAVEVHRPGSSLTIFEFGSVAASTDKVTLAGYCPVSDDIQPCRWEILPATDDDAPQFRVVF
ncbi:uncharacterized protein LOC131307614 [Rhododendron vialii]|uniref:uncharacterized protein LOC131307614 n=1 Tax=Rhododendron vialii TaxID=182163 RepID=UPI00265F3377|nr:uncharacterized protein LOC131307614 [Rhododendron vialii]XP_058190224.1 uncharacterized protein LOC131307614 [Rhododendron vialii]